MPNFTFYGGRKQAKTSFFFLFQNLSVVPKKSTPGKFAYILHFQGTGTSVRQFEKTRIHFKSDFFAAVAVVDAKAPYYREYLRVLEALWWNKRNTGTQTSM